MAVRIRLTRIGKKKQPYYRVIVNDRRRPRDADYIEQVGYYDPNQDPEEVRLDRERLEHWVDNGAQPSDTVRRLIRKYTDVPLPTKRGESETEFVPSEDGGEDQKEAQAEATEAEDAGEETGEDAAQAEAGDVEASSAEEEAEESAEADTAEDSEADEAAEETEEEEQE